MWEQFRAIAARIGLSREEVEKVERSGEPTWVQHPRNPDIHIEVRPDPDWTQRMSDAWHGQLVNSRQQSAGTITIADGRLHVSDADNPEQGITANVVAGEYEVVLTVAHLGNEASGDYEEYVSHAYALVRGTDAVALIEPMTNDDGAEIFVETGMMAFTGTGVFEQLAAEHLGGRAFMMGSFLVRRMHATQQGERHWARVATSDGPDALIGISAGHRRGAYPLFKIADEAGNTVGVLVDFYVDNRP